MPHAPGLLPQPPPPRDRPPACPRPSQPQDRHLRGALSDQAIWRPHCLARWPGADADALYAGSWQALFGARARMPPALPLATDRIRAVTAAADARGGGAQDPAAAQAFEDVMRGVHAVGIAMQRCGVGAGWCGS